MIYRHGWYTSPRFVTFSHDGELVIAAGRRDDPINHQNGIVAFYDAVSGRTVRELPQQEIQRAALAADGRMLVVASSREGGFRGKRFVGVEAATGRTRWFNPPENQKDGFVGVAGMRFEANSPWLHVALEDGTVIRFNGLTGHEQRRFVAEWRTPEQQKAGRHSRAAHAKRSLQPRRSYPGLDPNWTYLRLGRRVSNPPSNDPLSAPLGVRAYAGCGWPHARDRRRIQRHARRRLDPAV